MDELEQLRQRVQQLEKELAEARQILSRELHELRTPLRPLKGFVRILLDDEKEEWYAREDRREFYEILDENIDRLDRHISTMLDIADMQTGKFVMKWQAGVDIREIIQAVVAASQKHTDKHVMALDFKPEQICIETDPDRFETLVYYLLHNAVKYSPDGGEVWVRAHLEPPNKGRDCETLLLQVEDQGLGLSKEELSRVGRIMGGRRRSKSPLPAGPNMVLRLITFLAEAHQGELWFESEEQTMKTVANLCIPVKQPKEQDSI